jgi:GT2 family glycosyltransferase
MDLSFIIVNWNTCRLLLNCLRSIQETVTGFTYEMIIVDNGSDDESVQEVRKQFGSQVILIENKQNLGFARANNQAIHIAQGTYLVLLNSDTVLKEGCINALISFLAATPFAAMAGPRMLNSDGTLQNSYDNFPTLVTELLNKSLLRVLFPSKYSGKNPAATSPFEVDSLIGACMAIRCQAIQQTGMFDEDYFFFLEETDWCFRMRSTGWQIFHCPRAEVIHLQGQSKRRSPARAGVEYYRSLYTFFKKNRSPASYVVLRIFRCLKLSINLLGTFLALCLTAGAHKKLRDKTKTYAYILCWHLMLCPDSWGLRQTS